MNENEEINLRTIVETEARSKSNLHRINDIEDKVEEIHNLTIAVNRLADNMETMLSQQKEQSQRLAELEKLPAKKWNGMTSAVINTLVSLVMGAAFGAIITQLAK